MQSRFETSRYLLTNLIVNRTIFFLSHKIHRKANRVMFLQSNILHCVCRLRPTQSKLHKQWEQVERLLLDFLLAFAAYPDGQLYAVRSPEVFETLLVLSASSPNPENRTTALLVLRNVTFNHHNRTKLLCSSNKSYAAVGCSKFV